MKKIMCLILTLFIMCSMVAFADNASVNNVLKIDGITVSMKQPLINQNNEVYISLEDVNEIPSLASSFDDTTNTGFIYFGYTFIGFKDNNKNITMQVDGVNKKAVIQTPAFKKNNIFYVPLKYICNMAKVGNKMDEANQLNLTIPTEYETYRWENGDVYEGDFVKGGITQHGYGKHTWVDGNVYEGNWFNGKRAGKGKYIWANGDVYEGDFSNGELTGYGKITWASSGEVYEGKFLNGKIVKENQTTTTTTTTEPKGEYVSYNKRISRPYDYLNKIVYVDGEVVQMVQNKDGSLTLLVDENAGVNDFIDMYNTYGDGEYYVPRNDFTPQYTVVYSKQNVDAIVGDRVKIYGKSLELVNIGNGNVPAVELTKFDRNKRTDEYLNEIYGY